MCYRRGNRSPRRKTSPPPSKRSIIHQKMQLGYMNSNRPSKPNLPDVPKPSKLLAPTRLRRTFFFSSLPDSATRQQHPPSLASSNASQNSKNTQHSKLVWVVFGQKSPLNRYDNERGNEKRLQALSNWVGVLKKPLLGFFSLNGHTYLVGMRGIYTGVRMEYEESVFPKTGLAGDLTSRLD